MSRSLCVAKNKLEIVKQAFTRSGYSSQQDLAEELTCNRGTISKFFNGRPVERLLFREICDRLSLDWHDLIAGESKMPHDQLDLNFLGRQRALSDLDRLVKQYQAIVIQGLGGVGKTVLARHFLNSRFKIVLELSMGKESKAITPAEGVIEHWLVDKFQQDAGRDFGTSLLRLRQKLQERSIGILIDNLEPALDSTGKVLAEYRDYVELLELLVDPSLKSFTILTSRSRVCECGLPRYSLSGLDLESWQVYFSSKHIEFDEITLAEIHRSYGGNAKSMNILCGEVDIDFSGNLTEYWNQYRDDLLANPELESLIVGQFDRLEMTDPSAHQLLCRMGCYRYQDVQKVSRKGLFALMWDLEDSQKNKVITALQRRNLVESDSEGFWLHPVLQFEAKRRLRMNDDYWYQANLHAAEYWSQSVDKIRDVSSIKSALEAYYHYSVIQEYGMAVETIVEKRTTDWIGARSERLGNSAWRLGLFSEVREICQNLSDVSPNHPKMYAVYSILGIADWVAGNPRQGIQFHLKSIENLQKNSDSLKKYYPQAVGYQNVALCYFDLWMLNQCLENIDRGIESFKQDFHYSDFNLEAFKALIYSEQNQAEASLNLLELSEKLYAQYRDQESMWAEAYFLLFSGRAKLNLKSVDSALLSLEAALSLTTEASFPQGQGKAKSLLGELYRNRDNSRSLDYQQAAIQTLDKISAICDLAESHFFQALTYRDMGNLVKAQESLDRAQELYRSFDAPLQIERTNKAFYQP